MKKLFGGILLAIGILIAGTSGLCSLVFLITMLGQRGPSGDFMLVLVLGGVPFALGSGLSWFGWKLLRSDADD